MTVIATASNPRFSVSRVDIDRAGPTYTVDTLRDLQAELGPDADLFFITGADALAADPVLAGRRRVVRAGPLRRRDPARALRSADADLPADTVSLVEVPGAGDLVDRVPRPGRRRVSRSGTSCRTAWSSTSPSVGSILPTTT